MGYPETYLDTYEADQHLPRLPVLETVVWNIDGSEVLVDNDWACTATDRGGFEEALIRVLDSDRLPRGVIRGMTLTAYERGSGEVVWDGTVDGEPRAVGLGLEVRGIGNQALLANKETPRNYMSRDLSVFRDAHDQPHDFASSNDTDEIAAEIKGSSLWFMLEKGETQATGAQHLLAAWTPGTTIQGYAFDYRKTFATGNQAIRTQSFTGSQGPRTLIADQTLASGGGAINTWLPITQAISSPENAITLGIQVVTGDTWATKQVVRIKNLQLFGVSPDGSMGASDVVADLGAAVGLNTSRVESFTSNILPFYPKASWAESVDYIATLTDRHWGVYESSMLEYGTYTTEWTVAEELGATIVRCDPLRPASSIIVNYPDLAGDNLYHELTFTPNPNETQGISPQAEFEIADRQADATIASNVASWNETYLKSQGWELEVLVTHARQNGVPVSPYRIRPGGLLTVADCHPHGSATERIRGVRYTSLGVEVDCNVSVSIVEEIEDMLDIQRHRVRHKKPRHPRRRRRPRIPRG